MNSANDQVKKINFQSLNGLRGLATLMVFSSHVVGMICSGTTLVDKFILWDGAAAVDIFFILSGFFLSIRYVDESNERFDLFSYLIRRFFRLYPPLLVGLLFTLVLRYYVFQPGMMGGLSDWINSKWLFFPDVKQIIKYCLLQDTTSNDINSTMWAMSVIIKISFLFPIIIVLLRKINSLIGIISLLFITYVVAANSTTLGFIPLFVLGGITAKYYIKVLCLLEKKHKNKFFSLILLLMAILIINIRFSFPLIFGYKSIAEHSLFVDTLTSMGCLFLIYYAISINKLGPVVR